MSMAIERYLDDLFAKAANDSLKASSGKVYQYSLLDDNYIPIYTGKCTITNRVYDKDLDCDLITITDCDNHRIITVNQFKVDLKLI